MGAVTFGLDKRLIERLISIIPFEVLVETGTFRGETIAAMRPHFARLISIELSEPLCMAARERFAGEPGVEILHGDSATRLVNLRRELDGRSVLYWLDAHWCAAEGSAGERSQCPLVEELTALGSLDDGSAVIIDDARLFLTIPPPPHEVSQWPAFSAIVSALTALSDRHDLTIVNDMIVFVPCSAAAAVRDYARAHGVDWLLAYRASQAETDYRTQLEEKEAVIRELDTALTANRAALQAQQSTHEHENARNIAMLKEKEAVIQELSGALTACRETLQSQHETIARMRAMLDESAAAQPAPSEGRSSHPDAKE